VLIATIALASAMNAAAAGLVASKKAVGVQYAVIRDGTIAASGAVGRADIATNTPVTEATRFRIGSITKMFTAVAVMQLVQQGALSLDDTLARFDPSFRLASSIRVRDLLMHRSGIPDYFYKALLSGAAEKPATPQAIAASMAGSPSLSAPGSTFSYSNTNYVLLGLIVERVSGLPLHEYYRANIFAPAGMTQTFAGSPPAGVPVTVGYARVEGKFAPADSGDVSWSYGCGDVWSTAQDLARFDLALMDGALLKAATLQRMIDAALPAEILGPRVGYGLGVTTAPSGGADPFVGHHGGVPGFAAENEMLLPDHFAMISIGNLSSYPTNAMNSAIFEELYPDRMRALHAEAVADAQAQSGAEDTALTQRFTKFVVSLLSGTADTTGLGPTMTSALTQDAVKQLAAYFTTDGTFVKLQYVSQDAVEGYRRYHYTAVFSGGSQAMTFVLDSHNDLAGFFLQ
jgi:D-alanyl-D-alanine carboxypeptidase